MLFSALLLLPLVPLSLALPGIHKVEDFNPKTQTSLHPHHVTLGQAVVSVTFCDSAPYKVVNKEDVDQTWIHTNETVCVKKAYYDKCCISSPRWNIFGGDGTPSSMTTHEHVDHVILYGDNSCIGENSPGGKSISLMAEKGEMDLRKMGLYDQFDSFRVVSDGNATVRCDETCAVLDEISGVWSEVADSSKYRP